LLFKEGSDSDCAGLPSVTAAALFGGDPEIKLDVGAATSGTTDFESVGIESLDGPEATSLGERLASTDAVGAMADGRLGSFESHPGR